MMNANGLSWERWLAAAGRDHRSLQMITAMNVAWLRGEDPTDWRADREGSTIEVGPYAECERCKVLACREEESNEEFRQRLSGAGWHLPPFTIATMSKVLCPQCLHCEVEGHADCGGCDYCHFCGATMCERCRFKAKALSAESALKFAIQNNMEVTFSERLRDLSSAIDSMVVAGECKCIKEVW